MKLINFEKLQKSKIKLFIIVILLLQLCIPIQTYAATDDEKKEITSYIEQIFQRRNKAILSGDLELIKSIYNTDTK